jgi:signal transduction histidine kinase
MRSRRDWLLVWLLVAAISVVAVLDPFLRTEGVGGWVAVGLTVMLTFALPWRRSHPLQATLAYVGVFIVTAVVTDGDELMSSILLGIIITYALVRWASAREAAIGLTAVLAAHFFHGAIYDDELGIYAGFFTIVLWLLPAVIGGTMRYRAEVGRWHIEDALQGERAQLARELHDTVAHYVSTIAIRAQAARVVAASQPEAAVEALHVIEQTASRTLAEMRKIVGALRAADESDTAPQPRLSDIERLAARSQGGPRVDVSFSGKLDTLDPSVESGLYRIAQEAITNARRHGRHARRITVRVDGGDDSVCLTVTDDGDADPTAAPASWGYGLTGMNERTKLLGGHLEAGPDPDGGWCVRAVLPTGGPR